MTMRRFGVRFMKLFESQADVDVCGAEKGKEAIEKAQELDPDLIC
jgi:hypothetical protein